MKGSGVYLNLMQQGCLNKSGRTVQAMLSGLASMKVKMGIHYKFYLSKTCWSSQLTTSTAWNLISSTLYCY